jgi:hypothetical protein
VSPLKSRVWIDNEELESTSMDNEDLASTVPLMMRDPPLETPKNDPVKNKNRKSLVRRESKLKAERTGGGGKEFKNRQLAIGNTRVALQNDSSFGSNISLYRFERRSGEIED